MGVAADGDRSVEATVRVIAGFVGVAIYYPATSVAAAIAFDSALAGPAALATLAEEGTRGYQALALMQRGALALDAGNRDEAASFFEQAASAAPDRLTRDTARYKALLIEQSELSYDDVVLRAEPLTEGTGPAGPLARELMGLAAIQAERWDEARSHYEQIAFSLDVPQNLQRRAGEALALIAQRAPAPAAEAQTPASEGEEN